MSTLLHVRYIPPSGSGKRVDSGTYFSKTWAIIMVIMEVHIRRQGILTPLHSKSFNRNNFAQNVGRLKKLTKYVPLSPKLPR